MVLWRHASRRCSGSSPGELRTRRPGALGRHGLLYLIPKDTHLVCTDSLSLECNPRFPADAVAQRVSSLARGDLLRPVGGEAQGKGSADLCVGIALGALEFPVVDRAGGARGAQKALKSRADFQGPEVNSANGSGP